MNKQRKILITTTYNEMGIITDTKAEEVAQPNLQPTLATDAINRQDAIDALDCINGVEEVLRSLPTIQPKRAEGEWVLKNHLWECNKCGCRINVKNPLCENDWNYYFCPHCGTKMIIAVQRF